VNNLETATVASFGIILRWTHYLVSLPA